MSAQFTFWILPEEHGDFESHALTLEPSTVLLYVTAHNELGTAQPGRGVVGTANWLQAWLIRDVDRPKARREQHSESGNWYFNPLTIPAINITRCCLTDGRLTPGRLYYRTGGFAQSGLAVVHTSAFLAWAKRAFSTSKAMLARDPKSGDYYSDRARAWRTNHEQSSA